MPPRCQILLLIATTFVTLPEEVRGAIWRRGARRAGRAQPRCQGIPIPDNGPNDLRLNGLELFGRRGA